MTNPADYLDFVCLTELRLRLRQTRDADPVLGCAIVALLLPGTIAAAAANAWLAQPGSILDTGLNITGSVDDALRFLGQLGFGPGWSIIHEDPDDEPSARNEGRYGVWLKYRLFDCYGSGHTAVTALVDVAIHATALGAAGYKEEEVPLLAAEDVSSRAHDDEEFLDFENNSSDDPKERTRQVIGDFWPYLDVKGRICLKNDNGRFGAMDDYTLHAGILCVVDRDEAVSTCFDTLESLLAAGWVLD